MTLTNQALFFSHEEGWPLPEKTLEGDHRCCKKSPAPKALCRSTCNRGKQLEKQQQMKRKKKQEEQQEEQQEDTEDSGGESGDDKCMVCGEKEEDDVDIEDWVACEMCSQWIHSKCIPSNHP